MKHLWDCDAVTLIDVAGFGLVDHERTAVDFFADERALGCAFSRPDPQTAAVAVADLGEEPQAGPQMVGFGRDEVANSEPAAETSKRPRRNVAEGRAPLPREDTLPSGAEDGRRGQRRRRASLLSKTSAARSFGCVALIVSAGALLVWPDVLPRLPAPAFLAATTSLRAVTSGGPSSAHLSAPASPPPPALDDERATAEALIAALAAAHPSDEAYREAARILRGANKNTVASRRP